jgi:hypothetical protein
MFYNPSTALFAPGAQDYPYFAPGSIQGGPGYPGYAPSIVDAIFGGLGARQVMQPITAMSMGNNAVDGVFGADQRLMDSIEALGNDLGGFAGPGGETTWPYPQSGLQNLPGYPSQSQGVGITNLPGYPGQLQNAGLGNFLGSTASSFNPLLSMFGGRA